MKLKISILMTIIPFSLQAACSWHKPSYTIIKPTVTVPSQEQQAIPEQEISSNVEHIEQEEVVKDHDKEEGCQQQSCPVITQSTGEMIVHQLPQSIVLGTDTFNIQTVPLFEITQPEPLNEYQPEPSTPPQEIVQKYENETFLIKMHRAILITASIGSVLLVGLFLKREALVEEKLNRIKGIASSKNFNTKTSAAIS